MNVSTFTSLLKHPGSASKQHTYSLEKITEAYPWFQAAQALYLKALKHRNSFKYNPALKRTAIHTTDRAVLFDFITSKSFSQHRTAKTISEKNAELHTITTYPEAIIVEPISKEETEAVLDPELFQPKVQETEPENTMPEETLPITIYREAIIVEPVSEEETEVVPDPEFFQPEVQETEPEETACEETTPEATLQLGKPLEFKPEERHSFIEWLNLTLPSPIDRSKDPDKAVEVKQKQKEKFRLIDKFIAQNPRIIPKRESAASPDLTGETAFDKAELMTETLARVYLEQKKFKKAIQAYKILSLKYPEKSGFFADQIKAIKKLQQK